MTMVLTIIAVLIALAILCVFNSDYTDELAIGAALLIGAFIVCGIVAAINRSEENHPQEPYYIGASVVATDTNNDITAFLCEDGNVYTVYGSYWDDTEYLLTMDPHKTKDKSDDEVLVVWRCVE